MSDAGTADTSAASRGPASLSASIGRYFFYGWLFRDASAGTELERAAAPRR